MLIVKLGGSVITDKSRYNTFRDDATKKIVRVLKDINDGMIIVHGAGSFGHIKAREYGLPGKINKRTLEGFSIVHEDVMKLNVKVTDSLIEEGITAVSVSPSSTFTSRSNYSQIYRFLDKGIIPVSHGDCYLSANSVNIVSGDTIIYHLSRMLKPEKVVFFSDTDGIFNKDPKKYGDAKLLTSLKGKIDFSISGDDVTGGMKAKVSMMKRIASHCGSVSLINGNHPERMFKADSKEFIGTVIRK